MTFSDEMKPLYVKTDASRVGLGAALLQTREGTSYLRDETLEKISAIIKIKLKLIISKIFYRHTHTNTSGCFLQV